MTSSQARVADASRRYFNRWARGYDFSPAQLWFRQNHRLLVAAVNPAADARILDLGCGTGQLAVRLAQHVPKGNVLGVDPAEEMLRVARRHGGGRRNLRFAAGSGDQIPADAASFDVAVSTISFHHWSRPAESLREIARVLKPGGRLFILDFCRDNPLTNAFDALARLLQPAHFGIASSEEMRGYFVGAGFREVRITRPRWFLMLTQGRTSPPAPGRSRRSPSEHGTRRRR